MNDDIGFLGLIGFLCVIVFCFVGGVAIYETEFINQNRIYKGEIIEIEENKLYYCKPTKETIKYLKLEKKIKDLSKKKIKK